MRREELLRVEAVSKRLSPSFALHAISFEVKPAEAVGLLGPNGSGKTTLLDLLCGLSTPDSGAIRLDGEDLALLHPAVLISRGVVRIFQEPRCLENRNVYENVELGAYWRDKRGRRVMSEVWRVLDLLGLREKQEYLPKSLSFFELRKLELARAMLAHPRVCLIDELTSGFSEAERRSFLPYVGNLKAQGISLILVEHDLTLVERLCDSVVVLDAGEIAFAGSEGVFSREGKNIWESS